MPKHLALNERQLNVNDDDDNDDNEGDNESCSVDDDVSGNNVGEGVGVADTTEESIDSIQIKAGDDDEGDVDREVDKGGDVITDENGENEDTAEEDVTVTCHAPLSTVTDWVDDSRDDFGVEGGSWLTEPLSESIEFDGC